MKLPKNIKIEGSDPHVKKWEGKKLYHFEIFTPENDALFEQRSKANIDPKEMVLNGTYEEYREKASMKSSTFEGKRKIIILDKNNKSTTSKTNCTFKVLQVEKGHLMCAPVRSEYRKYPYGKVDPYANIEVHMNTSIINPKSLGPPEDYILKKFPSDVLKPKDQTPRSHNSSKFGAQNQNLNTIHEEVTRRSQLKGPDYGWKKTVEDLASWSQREQEWWYAEKRLLFATTAPKEREVWLAVLAWVLEQHI